MQSGITGSASRTIYSRSGTPFFSRSIRRAAAPWSSLSLCFRAAASSCGITCPKENSEVSSAATNTPPYKMRSISFLSIPSLAGRTGLVPRRYWIFATGWGSSICPIQSSWSSRRPKMAGSSKEPSKASPSFSPSHTRETAPLEKFRISALLIPTIPAARAAFVLYHFAIIPHLHLLTEYRLRSIDLYIDLYRIYIISHQHNRSIFF